MILTGRGKVSIDLHLWQASDIQFCTGTVLLEVIGHLKRKKKKIVETLD